MSERDILRATMHGEMTVRRQTVRGMQVFERVIYEGAACALSRSAHTSAPQVPPMFAEIGESYYRMTLFFTPEVQIKAGDRLCILQEGYIFEGVASDSFIYPSHGVCVVAILSERSVYEL